MSFILGTAQTSIDVVEIFSSSPIIYGILLFLSLASFSLCIYCLCTFRTQEIAPEDFLKNLEKPLQRKEYATLLRLCHEHSHPLAKMIKTGVNTRQRGLDMVIQSMQSEGKRSMARYWQKLSLLHDIAGIAPMFGLLGTILGMFYAFYDMNRSVESIQALFDGLGIAIGTTVLGLIVAISSMIFYALLKQRLIRILHHLEKESLNMGHKLTPIEK
ncbi:MAG: MotA/TolQ/ExbB proton channel family protein [Chlamydiota bacterium]